MCYIFVVWRFYQSSQIIRCYRVYFISIIRICSIILFLNSGIYISLCFIIFIRYFTYSEELLQRAIQILTKDRTSIVIAHRLATIVNADVIVVMDQGKIVEKGTHQELLQITNGYYKGLYNSQFQSLNA